MARELHSGQYNGLAYPPKELVHLGKLNKLDIYLMPSNLETEGIKIGIALNRKLFKTFSKNYSFNTVCVTEAQMKQRDDEVIFLENEEPFSMEQSYIIYYNLLEDGFRHSQVSWARFLMNKLVYLLARYENKIKHALPY